MPRVFFGRSFKKIKENILVGQAVYIYPEYRAYRTHMLSLLRHRLFFKLARRTMEVHWDNSGLSVLVL